MYNKLKLLYLKHREIISYVFFGGLTTLVSLGVRYGTFYLGVDTIPSITIAWICSVTFAFFVNKIFVFKSVSEKKSAWFKQAAAFYSARLTTYFLEQGFTLVTVKLLGWNEAVMILVVQGFILVGNYLLSKFWVFKKK